MICSYNIMIKRNCSPEIIVFQCNTFINKFNLNNYRLRAIKGMFDEKLVHPFLSVILIQTIRFYLPECQSIDIFKYRIYPESHLYSQEILHIRLVFLAIF